MKKDDILFSQIDMLNFYDQVLVPAFFEPWSEVLLDQMDSIDGQARFLDLACGPGTVIRTILRRFGREARVLGVDISPGMLDIARKNLPDVDLIEAPAASLPRPSDSMDVVTCQQGFQYFPDRLAAAKEVKRVLRKGGQFAFAVWGPIEASPQFNIFKKSMAEAGASAEALKIVEAPFSWNSVSELQETVKAADLTVKTTKTLTKNAIYSGGADILIAAAKAAPFGPHLLSMPEDAQRVFTKSVIALSEKFRLGGRFVFPMECNIVTGRKE